MGQHNGLKIFFFLLSLWGCQGNEVPPVKKAPGSSKEPPESPAPSPSGPGEKPTAPPEPPPLAPCTTAVKTRTDGVKSLADIFVPQRKLLQRVDSKNLPDVWKKQQWFFVTKNKNPGNNFARIMTTLEKNNKNGDGGHEGVDLPVSRGENIYAVGPGTVIYVLNSCKEGDSLCGNGWGNHLVIDHGESRYSRSCHLDKVLVQVGEKVEGGTGAKPIGLGGNTGLSSGVHLHLEIGVGLGTGTQNGKVDPCGAPFCFTGVYDYAKLSKK